MSFGYKIKYNQVDGLENPNIDFMDLKVKPKFNGNIAEVDWRTATEENEPLKRYGYVYDNLNRLSAGFYQKEGSETSKEYFERMEYDRNGNITRLQRSAGLLSGSTTALSIDNLKYDYSGNRLTKVTEEQIGNSNGYPYFATHNTITYDDNGNMISHKDKGINSILYNYLNLPSAVISGSGRRASSSSYLYRADGIKLKKILANSLAMSSTEVDYLDGFQYNNKVDFCFGCPNSSAVLKFVPTSEGYFDFEKNLYIYNYTDHLGNIRLSYADSNGDEGILPRDMNSKYCEDMGDGNMACYDVWMPGEVVEVNNYYPFGLMHNYTATTMNSYQYKYNGKELQETGMYDYGARFYMPDIGRWGVVDPLAERYIKASPYHYAFNNPVFFKDPDGKQIVIYYEDDKGKQQFIYSYSAARKSTGNNFLDNAISALDTLYESDAMNMDTNGDGIKDVNMMQKLIDHKKTLGIVKSDFSSEFTFGMGYDKKNNKWDGDLYQIGRIRFNDEEGVLYNNESSEGLVQRYENGKLIKGDKINSPTSILGHEMVHSYNHIFDNANWFQRRKQKSENPGFKNQEEQYTTLLSNQINEALKEPQRNVYQGIYVPVKNVKSNEIKK